MTRRKTRRNESDQPDMYRYDAGLRRSARTILVRVPLITVLKKFRRAKFVMALTRNVQTSN